MTKKQIKLILESIDLSLDEDIITDKISSIYVGGIDASLYLDDNTCINFDTNHGNLLVYYPIKHNSDGTFERTSDVPTAITAFSEISGINLVTPIRFEQPYRFGRNL